MKMTNMSKSAIFLNFRFIFDLLDKFFVKIMWNKIEQCKNRGQYTQMI